MGRIASNIATNPIFTAMGEPTGFVDRVATLSFNDANYTFTITGDHDIYIKGVLRRLTTTSKQIADTTGLHWIYYDDDGVIQESTTAPDFDHALIATVYWNTSMAPAPGVGVLADERHGIVMDYHTHTYLHYTVGTRYESGLTGTFDSVSFSTTQGVINDEDLAIAIGAQNQCLVFYKNGSANFEWDGPQAEYFKLNGATLRYNNGNNLADIPLGSYVAYWIFATNDVDYPIASLMGQSVETNINSARSNFKYENLALGTLPYQEMKLIYRVIMRNQGGVATYIEAQDLRVVSNLPAGTYVATVHDVLTGLEWSVSGHNDTNFAVNPGGNGNSAFGTLSPATTDRVTILQTLASNLSTGLYIYNSAAAVAGTVYGQRTIVDGAGNTTNVAGYFSASGATTNRAIQTNGTIYVASSANTTGIVFGSLGTATIGIDINGAGLAGTGDYFINCLTSNYYWRADGMIRVNSVFDVGRYFQRDGSWYAIIDFTSTIAMGMNRTLNIDVNDADRTIAWLATGQFNQAIGYAVGGVTGWSGTFTEHTGKTVTVAGGIVTNCV